MHKRVIKKKLQKKRVWCKILNSKFKYMYSLNNKPKAYSEIIGIHFERSRIYAARETSKNGDVRILELSSNNDSRSYPLYAFFSDNFESKYGKAANDSRFMNGVFIYDIINFIGKEYPQIPYPESYDIKIKKNADNSVSFITNKTINTSETVYNIFTKLIEHFVRILKQLIESEEISYVLTVPPYLTKLQTQLIENEISKCGLKLIKTIYEPIASVFVYLKSEYMHGRDTYIVVNLDKNSFTGSVVTVYHKHVILNYFIRDDNLGYSGIVNNFIDYVYDKLIQRRQIKEKKQQEYKELIEDSFHCISCNVNYSSDIDDLDINIQKCYVEELWKSLAYNIYQKMDELFDYIDDNGLKDISIVLSGSGSKYGLFKDKFCYYFRRYRILNEKDLLDLSEVVVTGATLIGNDDRGYIIDSTSFTENMSYGVEIGNKNSVCSCFKEDSVRLTEKFESFVDMTYPVIKYMDSEKKQIKIDKKLLRKIKNNTCLSTKYVTTDLPTVFTIPLSYTINQKYELKKETEKCGFKVLYLLYSSIAVVIYSIYYKKITKDNCNILVFNYTENANEMSIIDRKGKRIELNNTYNLTVDKYTHAEISKLFSEYLSNDEKIFDKNKEKQFNEVVNIVKNDLSNIHEKVDFILIPGNLEKFPMLKDYIIHLFSEKQIICLDSDCISRGASIYANQLLTKSNYFEIVDYSEYNDVSFGIDLGTTYSCAGFMKDNNISMVDYSNSSSSFPSVVFFEKKTDKIKCFLGKYDVTAKSYPVYDSKRFIGKSYYEINEYKDSNYLFRLVEKNGNVYYDIDYNNTQLLLSPEDVSSTILRYLKEKSIRRIKTEIQLYTIIPCVITTPALFSYKQRYETKRAAEKAGLKVLSIINEPTAAAIAYINDKSVEDEMCEMIVYDFGGGTFDVTIVEKYKNNLKVICSDGDDHLGGEDITDRLVNYISEDVKRELGLIEIDNKLKSRILKECESAKIQLSSQEIISYECNINYNDCSYKKYITRAELDELCRDIYDKTIAVTNRCIKNNNININDIKYLLLCGGSSRIPYIKERVEKEFINIKVMKNVNCKEAVAQGAAIYANILRGKQERFVKVVDILNHSLYYKSSKEEKLIELFKKNEALDDCHCERDIMTKNIGFTWIKIYEEVKGRKVFINKLDIYSDYKRKVKVYFDVNSDGVLVVSYILNGIKKTMEYQFE